MTEFTIEEIALLKSDFSCASITLKNKILDLSMRLFNRDRLNEKELSILFERLDLCKRYEDMLRVIILYPKVICQHYEGTHDIFMYNIEHEWDWNLKKLGPVIRDNLNKSETVIENEWENDLHTVIFRNQVYAKTALGRLIKSRVKSDDNPNQSTMFVIY